MALTISGTSNGKLGNLSLSANTGDILDSANTSFFGTDSWYLNTNWTTNADMTAWTRFTGDGNGRIGSEMTVSSGVFTFPTTGVWLVLTNFYIDNDGASDDASYVMMETTSDNFSTTNSNDLMLALLYPVLAKGMISTGGQYIFDCTDTSNDKLKFVAKSFTSGNIIVGFQSGNYYGSWVHFVRLGDT